MIRTLKITSSNFLKKSLPIEEEVVVLGVLVVVVVGEVVDVVRVSLVVVDVVGAGSKAAEIIEFIEARGFKVVVALLLVASVVEVVIASAFLTKAL